MFWAFALRLGQAAIEASLTLVIGAVVAGVLRRMVGPAGTRKLFGRGAKGLFRGWLAGMLLPVCSLGVIPVAREMRRAGVPGGTVLAFVLAAPLLNPISFLYGLTLAEPTVILTFAALSLVLSTMAGFLWDAVFAGAGEAAAVEGLARAADAEPSPAAGPRRVLAVAATAARELAGRDLAFYAVGLAGSAALSALIPFGALQHTMHHSDRLAPLEMAALAVPIYTAPLQGMMKIGLMFEHGNSIGAAFVLFALGVGSSLGTLAWLATDFGGRRVLPWFAAYLALILGLAYTCDAALYDTRRAEADHTHAFDDYSSPFPADSTGAAATTRAKLAEKFGPLEQPAAVALAALVAAGYALRRLDRAGRVERWLTAPPPPAAPGRAPSRWAAPVPGPVLGAVAVAGLVAFSVAGAFVYYPERKQCLTQMAAVRADASLAVRVGKADEAILHLEELDLLVRKLEVGVFLRTPGVTAAQSKAAEDLREALEAVRDALIADDRDGARRELQETMEPAYRACRAAFGD